MFAQYQSYVVDEHGGTTVNWVVITAAIVSLALSTIALLSNSVQERGTAATTMMDAYEIDTEFDAAPETVAVQAALIVPATPTPDPASTPTY